MKLKELLKELQGFDIKVGAKSQFLYCGSCNNKTPATIKRLSERLFKSYTDETNQIKGMTQARRTQVINEFIPFLEREVIEVYDSLIHENEKIIRVTGEEICDYWDKEEYDKDKRKHNE